MTRLGIAIAALWAVAAIGAPWLAPYDPGRIHPGRAYAPPTRIHFISSAGVTAPYFHPLILAHRLERRFEEDRTRAVRIVWFSGGRLFGPSDPEEPLLLFGADGLGRDVFSRIMYGARVSLTLALIASALALMLGGASGLLAGYFGGTLDALLSRLAELVLVLPSLYVVVALRAALPLVLSPQEVFALVAVIFALVAWPMAARGVRAVVAAERSRGYVEAARAAGAPGHRILLRHLLPAVQGLLWTQFALLVPACLLVEGALSFAGLGFPDYVPTWGTMLQEAANIGALMLAPWLLAPAIAMVTVVLAINLLVQRTAGTGPV
ncbi:MAG TPA: ABC transporter permease [Vicinamibacterales bacterium]|nr:ABC transporter permease [Vicinamibacterales bacterium]